MSKSLKLTKKNHIATLTFDLDGEKVNKLSSKIILEFEGIIDELKKDEKIKFLVIQSAKKGIFIAGADIKEIKNIKNEKDALVKAQKGHKFLKKLEKLPFSTICVINGACLGGGLELALACNYRIGVINKKTQLGLPEVNLGIFPGFGGTQRLPRLVGLVQSLSMILPGKAVDAKKAYKIGLVDLITDEAFLEDNLSDFLSKIEKEPNIFTKKRAKLKKSRHFKEFFGKYFIFHFAEKNLLKKTNGNYPAPLTALDVIKRTYNISNHDKGYQIEAEEFSRIAFDKIAKNLIDIFFINDEIKKDSGVNKNIKANDVKKAGLVGAGIMGGGIAWLFSKYDIRVRMKDIANEAIALGYKQVVKIYAQLKKIRKYKQHEIDLKMQNVTSTLDYSGFDDVDVVVEAVVEDIDVKKKVLAELEQNVGKNTIIASNTSSLSLTKMATALKRPQNFVGMHFFNPVNRMPLVEIIRGEKTSDQTVATIVNLSKKMGKTPIVVKDVGGFLVNRILLPFVNEAAYLLEDGGDIEEIDEAIHEFGMPMGPFTLADTVGIDVGCKVSHILEKDYGKRMKVSQFLSKIEKNKELLGKKSGIGFYKYDKNGKKLGENEEIYQIVKKISKDKLHLTKKDIIDRCILVMVNEAARCLEENVVKNEKYLDMAMIMGAGFPPFRGGLMKHANDIGIDALLDRLEELEEQCGERFKPAKLLVDMGKNGKMFY